MDVRPQDLPELRAALSAELSGPDAFSFHRDRALALSRRYGRQFDPAEMQRMDVQVLRLSELFYVAPEMIDLAKVAARSLPPYVLEPEDLPAEYGFLFLGNGAFKVNDMLASMAALEWAVYQGGIRMYFYADTKLLLTHMLQTGQVSRAQVDFHRTVFGALSPMEAEAIIKFGHDPLEADRRDEQIIRTIRAIWLLMQQPLADVQKVEPDRATRKRLQRTGHEPAPVRVIELRRRKHRSAEPGESSREYHHRWITRGHWRQQWYPARQVHRPVWIAPHLKGPEGAPLIGGERVYALKR